MPAVIQTHMVLDQFLDDSGITHYSQMTCPETEILLLVFETSTLAELQQPIRNIQFSNTKRAVLTTCDFKFISYQGFFYSLVGSNGGSPTENDLAAAVCFLVDNERSQEAVFQIEQL
jgi:hypothetical protein